MPEIPHWIAFTALFFVTFLTCVKSKSWRDWSTFTVVCFTAACLLSWFSSYSLPEKIYGTLLLFTILIFKLYRMNFVLKSV
jgi:putative effector of murein hydrolase LrgA (UPF0299 family)